MRSITSDIAHPHKIPIFHFSDKKKTKSPIPKSSLKFDYFPESREREREREVWGLAIGNWAANGVGRDIRAKAIRKRMQV